MRIVPGRQGWIWLAGGWRLFRRSVLGWLALVAVYWLLVAVVDQIPFAGPVLATVLLPSFSVSFMNVCAEVEAGRTPLISLLWSGFRSRPSALLALGGLYLLALLATLGLSGLADGGAVFRWFVLDQPPARAALEDGSLANGLLVAAAVGTPVLMAFWFAPVLIAWRELGAAQSLFYSFFASLRNWRAFLLYGAALCAAGAVMSAFIMLVAAAVAGNAAALRGVMQAMSIVMLPTIFASFYVGYRDVFPDSPAPIATPDSPPPLTQ
jgi:hypothetical protein